ncbi:MAG TPA: isocitrate lyase/phosphoenolpyruvate mutase family protein [Steroidobacteraceae bacterium]|nr:isocitrate lyase/phosphoenolpyruvate mutase family protein [Steroidobacteraceae bacterium]
MTTTTDKRRAFRRLHESGCFVIPNPWDVGSARYLESLGFKALATTSSGSAWSLARADGALSCEQVLEHLARMAAATDVPLNADFEDGFGLDSAGVAESVRLAVATGIAGLSIEDSIGPRQRGQRPGAHAPLFELNVAVERVQAARRAIDAAGGDVLLVARAECFLVGLPDIDMTIARLKAYASAGADCLYAPGIRAREHIRAVVEAVRPKPVNLLVSAPGEFTVAQIAELGVRRVSVGGALARAAWGGFMRAARDIAERGSFAGLADAASGQALNSLFDSQLPARAGGHVS